MADIADLPMLYDIDADYTPQYVKLARLIRHKIECGQYQRGDALPAADLAHEHGVSIKVVRSALAMLAANRYVAHPRNFMSYSVTWESAACQRVGETAPIRTRLTNESL
jgi:DNA-binding transcriptional regulator YhcF (GntR family)